MNKQQKYSWNTYFIKLNKQTEKNWVNLENVSNQYNLVFILLFLLRLHINLRIFRGFIFNQNVYKYHSTAIYYTYVKGEKRIIVQFIILKNSKLKDDVCE